MFPGELRSAEIVYITS